jgi:hypothetical protein
MRFIMVIVLAGVVGVTYGLLAHRVVLPMLVAAGIFLVGVFVLITQAGSSDDR